MIDLYAWPTPNGQKISIMLEEAAIPYRVIAVDINKGEQFDPAFLALSPNGRMPAIVDPDGPGRKPISLFESGAILIYLAEKAGRFLPQDRAGRYDVIQWLMWQMGGLGPMCGQTHHFRQMTTETYPYCVKRFTDEVARLYGVMDRRLAEVPWLGGDDYSIADMACWPWVRPHRRQGQDLADYPNVQRWFDAIAARPGVQRGMELLKEKRGNRVLTAEAREVLFGASQFQRR